MPEVTVIKCNLEGEETWRYTARVLERGSDFIHLEAYFDRADMQFLDIQLNHGDLFLETYYSDRWYNVFEVRSRENSRLKGYYCNISCPAEIKSDSVSYIDLALDLFVYPDGRQVILDEDEFSKLEITPQTREKALAALQELSQNFTVRFRSGAE
jgi:uncharacterized protein